jgi:hypothetical protein
MKTNPLLIILTTLSSITSAQVQNISNLNFSSIDNIKMDMKKCIGKKIVLATFDASRINTNYLLSLDTLNRKYHDSIVVIGIPVTDFGSAVATSYILKVIDSLNLSYPLTPLAKGKRGAGQLPLMTWVTTNSVKNPFNIDLENAGQIFVISTTGILYTNLPPYSPPNGQWMKNVLENEVTE